MKLKLHDRSAYYTTEKLSPRQSMTPEGFLLCEGVPIARTGQQLYLSSEIGLEDAGNGEVRIERQGDEVFRDETVASFEGKPVTMDHPEDFVSPENWKQLSVGVTQNVRQGTGIEDDLLFADLLITDKDAIEAVRSGLREVSCGYEADYEQTEPGRGVQRNIIGNHVALVERGRAGPRCSIQDSGEKTMAKKRSWWDRVLTAVKAKDAEALEEELKSEDAELEAEEDDDEDKKEKKPGDADPILKMLKTIDARLSKLEANKTKDASKCEDENEDEDKKTEDSDDEDDDDEETKDSVIEAETTASNPDATGKVYSGDSLKAIISRAEILAPGIAIPTGDALKSGNAATKIMRKALSTAYTIDSGKTAIAPFLMGREIKTLTADALHSVFTGAAELMRMQNNQGGTRTGVSTQDFGRPTTVADINAKNAAFWANRK